MSKRGKLRRKVVLPVTIIRRNGEERQLAHTLDVTEVSARLGGLGVLLVPGEVIEIQRGGVKAKFQVHWMGAPAGTLAGQAGIRGLDPNKSIWGIQLPADEPDIAVDTNHVRTGISTPRGLPETADPEQHTRYECSGGVTLWAPGSNYPVRVHLKSIHIGGVYVETITTLPLSTVVTMEAKVEGIQIETAGVVNTSTPRVGMDIAFHKISAESQRKVLQALQKLKQKAWDEQQVPPPPPPQHPLPLTIPAHNESKSIPQSARLDACRVLVTICQTLAADFDCWKSARSVKELEELRKAVAELQKKLATVRQLDEIEYLAASLPSGQA
jgi:hypothetical protein